MVRERKKKEMRHLFEPEAWKVIISLQKEIADEILPRETCLALTAEAQGTLVWNRRKNEPTWRCHQNPFIGDLGIQEPVILGEPQI